MNQNINNQQNSNEVNDERVELECKCAWYKNHAGQPSFDYSEGYDIGFHVGLNWQSNVIRKPIKNDDICLHPYSECCITEEGLQCKVCGYVIDDVITKMNERNNVEPIKDEELLEKLSHIIVSHYGKDDNDEQVDILLSDLGKDVCNEVYRISKQYAASKLNNTIEDKWIDITKDCPDYDEPVLWLREDGNMFVESLDKDGNSFLDDEVLKLFDIPKVKYWQPLPPQPTK